MDLVTQDHRERGAKEELDEVIALWRGALELTPPGNQERRSTLINLADRLHKRFRREGSVDDLSEIIKLRRAVLEVTPADNPNRCSCLINLADRLYEKFKIGNARVDLDEVITLWRAALDLMPSDHRERPSTLINLADRLHERFRWGGSVVDLSEIITLRRAVLEAISVDDPNRRSCLVNLADRLYEKFKIGNAMVDLEEVITLWRAVLELTPTDHPERPSTLINLADRLEEFRKMGSVADSADSINSRRAASELTSPRNYDHHSSRNAVVSGDQLRKEDTTSDLERSIANLRTALKCTPLGHPDRHTFLIDLANCLHERFQTQGTTEDLDEAIKLTRAALALFPPGHADRASTQDRLTDYLKTKIQKQGASVHSTGTNVLSSGQSRIKQLIMDVVFRTLENVPLRLVNTFTGLLCDRDAQISHFEGSNEYSELLLSIATCDDNQLEAQIRKVVSAFFRYATLSHRWGKGEPLLRDIQGRVVYDMDGTDGLEKLQVFCLLASKHRFLWAWSDTCCIDKDSSAELQEAIGSMFSWYRRSSVTIVYLSDVSDTGSFADSGWFKRGWTLQELLASPTVLFYVQNWLLYKNCTSSDHKRDGAILAELQQATGIAAQDLTEFCPGMGNARSRLQWASMRSTTRPEDIAYSLFGIFKLHLPVLYGESAENALGRLLAEIISQSGDVSVLHWVGEASSFHSCFPASITSYQTVPSPQPALRDPAVHSDNPPESARKLYSALTNLPFPRFLNRRLMLPCIVHWVTDIKLIRMELRHSSYVYEIRASGLRRLELSLSVKLKESSDANFPYALIRPWHPKSLDTLADDDICATWGLLHQLEQPFDALLLRRLLHNEYKRIAPDCTITVCIEDVANVGNSELQTLEIV